MPRIYSVGLEDRTPEEFLGLLGGLGVGEVLDIRTPAEAQAPGPFNRPGLADKLAAASIQYLCLDALLPPPAQEETDGPGPRLRAAVSLIEDQARKYILALAGSGQDPDALFGETTLILELLDKGVEVLLAGPGAELAPIIRDSRELGLKRRSTKAISHGMAALAAAALSAAVLGAAFYPGASRSPSSLGDIPVQAYGTYDEYMVSNLDPSVVYDQNGVPYRQAPGGGYVPLTEERRDDTEASSGSGGGGGSSGGWGGRYTYQDYREEGQSFRNGTAKPSSRISVVRGGFGSSAGVHASGTAGGAGSHGASGSSGGHGSSGAGS